MRLAIVHYHLNRGGVTRVIENQLASLDAVLPPGTILPVALIYGGRRAGWAEDLPQRLKSVRLSLHEVPEVDYDQEQAGQCVNSVTLDERIAAVLDDLEFSPQETVIHVHNHSMGKNVALPGAVSMLAERHYAVLLQIHDFAEDFRAANFRRLSEGMGGPTGDRCWHGRLYPQGSGVHYAVLNTRDREILAAAGVDTARLHLLPNPVPKIDGLPSREEARQKLEEQFAVGPADRFLLYPVRCIRRKNLGEALLHGVMAPPNTVVGLTLPPLNPAEKGIYNQWRELARRLELPCRFEVGSPGKLTLNENRAAADLTLTTSVAEGFGMVFLESWLAGSPMIGRNLPEITADFDRNGVHLDSLYQALHTPLQWLGESRFRQTVLEGYRRTLSAYERPEPAGVTDDLNAKTERGLVDFSDLDESLQEMVIRRVCRNPEDRRRLIECNPWLDRVFSTDTNVYESVRQNAEAVQAGFSLAPSGQRLQDVYRQVSSSTRGGKPVPLKQPERILDQFLDLRRFRLIRGE